MYRVAKSRRTLATGLKSTIYTTSPPDLGSQYLRPVSVASPTKTQIQEDPITSRPEPIRRDTDGRYHSLTGAASATVPWSGIQDDEPKAACTYVCSTAAMQASKQAQQQQDKWKESSARSNVHAARQTSAKGWSFLGPSLQFPTPTTGLGAATHSLLPSRPVPAKVSSFLWVCYILINSRSIVY